MKNLIQKLLFITAVVTIPIHVFASENGQTNSKNRFCVVNPDYPEKKVCSDSLPEQNKPTEDKSTIAIKNERIAPIEQKSVIYDSTENGLQQVDAAVDLTRRQGYRCDTVSAFRPMITSRGYILRCNEGAYTYDLKDMGGTWVVTIDN
jgi:hypothetical protein